ncbi:MAG TPA: hypothetical protein DCG57_09620, partial [Candidatus Riflebacteria bacterium]|nr:hypothetical protein [Candidatus Riflebacteria bacterium]
ATSTAAINPLPASTVALATDTSTVPDLRGKSLRQAMLLVNRLELKAVFEGNGIVTGQTPQPGRPVPDTKILKITLSPEPVN